MHNRKTGHTVLSERRFPSRPPHRDKQLGTLKNNGDTRFGGKCRRSSTVAHLHENYHDGGRENSSTTEHL